MHIRLEYKSLYLKQAFNLKYSMKKKNTQTKKQQQQNNNTNLTGLLNLNNMNRLIMNKLFNKIINYLPNIVRKLINHLNSGQQDFRS